jgi:hypothetical protein
MDKKQALSVIEQALNIATEKGSYDLAKVSAILQALNVLKQDAEQK